MIDYVSLAMQRPAPGTPEWERWRPPEPPDFVKLAARRNKKAVKKAVESAGPLFADAAAADTTPVTPAELAWKWKREKAASREGFGLFKTLEWVKLLAVEALGERSMPAADFAAVKAYVRRVYPMPDYGPGVWRDLLVNGKRIVLDMRREEDPVTRKVKLFETAAFPPAGWTPPLTAAEWDRMFQWREPEPYRQTTDDEAIHDGFLKAIKSKGR